VFLGLEDYPATDMNQGRVACALGSSGVTPATEKYLGTVTFRVTSLGGGSLVVSRSASDTQLRDPANQPIEVIYLGDIVVPIVP